MDKTARDYGQRVVERCLVVDDDHFDRMMLRRCLGRDRPDLDISECASLSDARAYLEDHSADLIVLDHRLPDGQGASFAAELRRDKRLDGVMICVVTSQDISTLDQTVPAMSKDDLNSRTLWEMVGEYLSLCEITRGTDAAKAVEGFGEALQERMAPRLARMLRSVRQSKALMGDRAPLMALDEMDRLEAMVLALSDTVAVMEPTRRH